MALQSLRIGEYAQNCRLFRFIEYRLCILVEPDNNEIVGLFFTGDGAHRGPEGYYQITGRMDDVINVTGHRLGTAEIEDAMVSARGDKMVSARN